MSKEITLIQPAKDEQGVQRQAGQSFTCSDSYAAFLVNNNVAAYVGQSPDEISASRVVLSSGLTLVTDTSIASCQMSPHAGDRFSLFIGQEPSVWIAGGLYNMLYSGPAGNLVYRSCPSAADPAVAANWSALVACIGNGVGGEAGNCAHSFVYVEGNNLYCYYTQKSSESIRVAIANINAPTVWGSNATCKTGPLGVTENGNACVVKSGGTYYMLLETQIQEILPSEGFTQSWNCGLLSCATPTGTFTTVLYPYTTGRPGGIHGSMSWRPVVFENNQWVHVYHGTGHGRTSLPTDIFVATNPTLSADTWTVQNGGFPIGTRKTANEYDQIADPFIVSGPNGMRYMFYEGGNNRTGVWEMNVTALLPVIMQTDGASSKRAIGGFETPRPQAYDFARGPQAFSNQPWTFPQGHPGTAVGTWALDNTVTGVPGGCRRYNSSAANGDSIQWEIALSPGSWQLDVYHQKGPSGGIVRLLGSASVDAGSLNFMNDASGNPSTIDSYAASIQNYVKSTFNFDVWGFEPFRGRFIITLTGKNASSSGYVFADFGWSFTRVGY